MKRNILLLAIIASSLTPSIATAHQTGGHHIHYPLTIIALAIAVLAIIGAMIWALATNRFVEDDKFRNWKKSSVG